MSPLYTSQFSIPYSPRSPRHTVDLHIRSGPSPTVPSFPVIYIHGGAFRDPHITSLSVIPSLLDLLGKIPHIPAVAAVNYRLSPYRQHRTEPSQPEDESRNVCWPAHLDDVVEAITWLAAGRFGSEYGDFLLVGHSVGATLAVHAAMEKTWTKKKIAGVVSLEGVFHFAALRDAHPGSRNLYDEFISGALGPEEEGRWEQADLIKKKEKKKKNGQEGGEWEVRGGAGVQNGVKVVVLGHSWADELVERAQMEAMREALEREEGVVVKVVECEGSHEDVVEGGFEITRCVGVAVDTLLEGYGNVEEHGEEDWKEVS